MSVAIIIISIMAIIVFHRWEFGISESVGIVVAIGLSVDYVVHLSASYIHSPMENRHSRMKEALTEMGTSILSGTLTTFGSGVMLFGGQYINFQKFAVLITSTISLSFFVSMIFFGAVMHIIGPEKKPKSQETDAKIDENENDIETAQNNLVSEQKTEEDQNQNVDIQLHNEGPTPNDDL